jgi:hypothetical protein
MEGFVNNYRRLNFFGFDAFDAFNGPVFSMNDRHEWLLKKRSESVKVNILYAKYD